MLEFCLEDGSRLALSADLHAVEEQKSVRAADLDHVAGPLADRLSEETFVIGKGRSAIDISASERPHTGVVQLLELSPIVLALLHNWWQWVCLEKSYVYSWADYLLSANFLMWLLLLGFGAAAGVYSVKRSSNRPIGIIGLVTLAINLILFLVPRK